MKKYLLLMLLQLAALPAVCQWQWPVKGTMTGENIVSRPQDRIDKELNYDHLFIAAPEGMEVVAPVDGTIGSLGLSAQTSLQRVTAYSNDGGTFDKSRKKLEQEKQLPVPLKYINGDVMLRLADGRKVWIGGLRGDILLKTGQRIAKGQVLGTVAYAYRAIGQPHISISVSDKTGKGADPMTPFGLKTTFKKAVAETIPKTLTVQQANEDFDFLISAMKECYPSFDDLITPEQCEQFVSQSKEKLKAPISYNKFYQVVRSAFTTQFLHDSHAWPDTPNPTASGLFHVPHVLIGSIGGKVIVTQAQQGYEKYLGKEVAAVNGIAAKELTERARQIIPAYDGQIQSHIDRSLLIGWDYFFLKNLVAQTAVMTFADGTTLRDQWTPVSQVKGIKPPHSQSTYAKRAAANRREQFSFRMLSDSVALLTLGDFQLDEVQLETIADSLRHHLATPNLIIDVRQNPGGDIKVCNRLLSWFIDQPTSATTHYDKVNSNSTYQCFVNCQNYTPDDKPFKDYVAREGHLGFFSPSTIDAIVSPDPTLHYGGRLLVLTDETSQSAASEFAAQLVRNHRAKTVGRETGTGYHYMTAVKFAHLVLPNSRIAFTLPLVKSVFDDEVTDRFPAHRGLLPDVEVALTYEEVYTSTGDPILDKALEIISNR